MIGTDPKIILIVEDEEPLLRAMADKLKREGYMPIGAKNGEEGLEVSLRNHPHLILLDVVMPKMDGLTMLGKLRQDAWGKEVPVILLTNLSDTERVSDALEHGVRDYLVKSYWTLEGVVNKVRAKLAQAPA